MFLDLVCGSASLAEKARDINHNSDQGYLETLKSLQRLKTLVGIAYSLVQHASLK